MKLGIVGNVAIDKRQAEHAWVLIFGMLVAWEPAEVWSGGATGIDSVVEACARAHNYSETDPTYRLVICRPEVQAWEPVGKKGFKARNLEIVNGVDRLVRISKHDGGNRTYGSGWTADRAEERLGVDNVYRYYI